MKFFPREHTLHRLYLRELDKLPPDELERELGWYIPLTEISDDREEISEAMLACLFGYSDYPEMDDLSTTEGETEQKVPQ